MSWLPLRNSKLQFPQRVFHWVEVWRLTGPLHDLIKLLVGPLLCCWKTHQRPIFSVLADERFSVKLWANMAPFIVPSMRRSHPVPSAQTALKCVSTSMLGCGNSVLGVTLAFFSKHSRLSWFQRPQLWFHLTTALSLKPSLSHYCLHRWT